MAKTGVNWTSQGDYPRFVVDVNGDGRADLVGFGIDSVWVSLNDGKGNFLPAQRAVEDFGTGRYWSYHIRTTGQFGGAQRQTVVRPSPTPIRTVVSSGVSPVSSRIPGVDLIGFGDNGVSIALSRGDGTFSSAKLALGNFGGNQGWSTAPSSGNDPRIVVDLNGDGLSDIVGFGPGGVWTALCTGQPTADVAAVGAAKLVLANFGTNQGWTDAHPRTVADLTGARRGDIVGFGKDATWVALGRGDGTFSDAKLAINNFGYDQGWRAGIDERFMADLTGDGKADFIGFGGGGVWTALGNGDGSFAAAKLVVANFGANQGWSARSHVRLATPLTTERRADIIGFGDDGVWTALSNGDGTFATPRLVLTSFGAKQGWTVGGNPRYLADTTGDGLADIVVFGGDGVWVARNKGDGTFATAELALQDFGVGTGKTKLKRIFVLMLENRSFDHFLGYSRITGQDTQTGEQTAASSLTGEETNQYVSTDHTSMIGTVSTNASDNARHDLGHQFRDVMMQLCGPSYTDVNPQLDGKPYPPVVNTGFVADYIDHAKETGAHASDPMVCFSPQNLPVLNQLAQEFVLCDRWFSSMPGPTEPNRMFVHAATSGTWDDSPWEHQQIDDEVGDEVASWFTGSKGGIQFDAGTLFDRMRQFKVPFRIYAGDHLPNVGLLAGISVISDVDDLDDFVSDVADPNYDAAYTFIEPNYATAGDWVDGKLNKGASDIGDDDLDAVAFGLSATSQHPAHSVCNGEALIKKVYSVIRASPHWNESMLILTWDEHGGFYDHVPPPVADPTVKAGRRHGFAFDRYGVRVPAVVISPLCEKNQIEHFDLEHSVIPATVEQVFGMAPLTNRDRRFGGLQRLATRDEARTDTPTELKDPVRVANPPDIHIDLANRRPPDPSQPLTAITDPWVISMLAIAAKAHTEAMPTEAASIKARVNGLKTYGDLVQYVNEVKPIVQSKRAEARKLRLAGTKSQ